ncbi:hypothetical protein Ancab_031161 [Ancistrocladus abbreviatus]
MDSNSNSPLQENNESKAAFCKLTSDAANRKYCCHSPVTPDGSPQHEWCTSPASLRDETKASKYQSRKDVMVSSRSQYGRSSDASRHSSRSSQGYSGRHEDHSRHGKYADEENRNYSRSSSQSGKEPRSSNHHSDYKDRETDYNSSREHNRDANKYKRGKSDVAGHASRDKERDAPSDDYRRYRDKDLFFDKVGSDRRHGRQCNVENKHDDSDRHVRDRGNRDEKRDYKGSQDHRSDCTASHDDSWGHRSDATSKRESGGYHMEGACKDEAKYSYSKDQKKRHNEQGHKDTHGRLGEKFEA